MTPYYLHKKLFQAYHPEGPSRELIPLYITLIREEYKEYLDATTQVDLADALIDLVVVTLGLVQAAGGWIKEEEGEECELWQDEEDPFWEYSYTQSPKDVLFSTIRRLSPEDDQEGVAIAANQITRACNTLLRSKGMNPYPLWQEVMRSNFAKIQPDGTLRRRADGKILKPEGWTPPDLETLLQPGGEGWLPDGPTYYDFSGPVKP